MIEVYVIMTLLGIGYVVNQQGKPNQKQKEYKVPPTLQPSTRNSYSSDMQRVVQQNEAERARASFAKSLDKIDVGRVVNRDKSVLVSTLAGKEIPQTEFKHNNMMPFFRGSINQNFRTDGNKGIMERFMGAPDEITIRKREQAPLFKVQKDVSNCNGMPVKTDYMKDRMVAPIAQNNVKPIPEVRVGPGVGQGYGNSPTGGFQQFEVQQYAMPKNVDELRIKSKPKTTFDARTVDGQKGSMRGKMGKMDKNRVDTYYENSQERYFKTPGANLKEAQPGVYDAKYTNRLDTTGEYTGTAFNNREQTTRAKVKPTDRMQLDGFEPTAPNLSTVGRQEKTDYGRANILVYNNQREVTTERTYQGNLTTLIKAMIAPIEDMVKISRKEYTVDNPRPYGEMQPSMPSKQPVIDPNNVMRTTIKETTIHDTQPANLRGATKITVYDPNEVARVTVKQTTIDNDSKLNLRGPNRTTVYDPNDVARTTIKETNLQESTKTNLKGATKVTVYDPNEIARTTIKETNLHDAEKLNMRAHTKQTVYDPNDIARTTMKETMLHDSEYVNLKGDRTANTVYVDEVAKRTVRETMPLVDTDLNVNGGRRVGVAYDPEQSARTTVRETTVDGEREGNVDGLQRRNAGYADETYDAKTTQKELYSDRDYFGQPATENGDGYQVVDIDLPVTQKEMISDIEYYGNSADQNQHVQMSYDDMYNACLNELREGTLVKREPTQTGVKLMAGGDGVNIDVKRSQFDIEYAAQSRITNQISPIELESVTRVRGDMAIEQLDRMDTELLAAFKNNPFTKPLDSFA